AMNFPPPTERQARILWMSVTSLAVGIMIALAGAIRFGFGWVVPQVSAVLLPLAVAGILAFLLDPVVDSIQRCQRWLIAASIMVFLLVVGAILILLATIIPQIVIEITDLAKNVPGYWDKVVERVREWMQKISENPEWQTRIDTATAELETRAAEIGTLV